jgi:hypothetical protein
MTKPLVLGTVLGGLAAFAWSMISWELIGWHEKAMSAFQGEDAVAAAIAAHAPASGTYLLPAPANSPEAALMEKFQRGPIVVAAVRRGGFGSYGQAIGLQIGSLMAAALLLTWLLLQAAALSYGRRVLFLAVAGLAASVIVDLPNWNWWGFSAGYTAVNLADSTLTWLFAGLVIAKVSYRPASPGDR